MVEEMSGDILVSIIFDKMQHPELIGTRRLAVIQFLEQRLIVISIWERAALGEGPEVYANVQAGDINEALNFVMSEIKKMPGVLATQTAFLRIRRDPVEDERLAKQA